MNGWSIRYSGGEYADIICPHGKAVEAINAHSKEQPFIPQEELDAWLNESAGWLNEYCVGHR